MERRQIRSEEDVIVVETDSNRMISVIEGSPYLRHIIPEFFLDEKVDENRHLLGAYQGSPEFVSNDRITMVRANFESMDEGQICHLISYVLQKVILSNGFYMVHAGAVEKNGRATLLIGTSKMGKSTFGLEMALEKGCKLFGDDAIKLSVEDELVVKSGNTYVGLSQIHRSHERIKDRFPNGSPFRYLDSRSFGIHIRGPTSLKHVIFLEPDLLGLNNTQEIDNLNGRIRLYSAVSEETMAIGYCLMNDGVALPSIGNSSNTQRLLESIKASNINFFKVSGNFYRMLNDIETIVNY